MPKKGISFALNQMQLQEIAFKWLRTCKRNFLLTPHIPSVSAGAVKNIALQIRWPAVTAPKDLSIHMSYLGKAGKLGGLMIGIYLRARAVNE